MITQSIDKAGLLSSLETAISSLQDLMSSLDESQINLVPYKDSWTAAMLFRHVSKSTKGMARAMAMQGKQASRDPAERIPGLQKTFLDFSSKLKSPEFIVPEEREYNKAEVTEDLNKYFQQFKDNVIKADLTELVEGLPLGEITKLELLYFTIYHTQRHLNQMKKIRDSLVHS